MRLQYPVSWRPGRAPRFRAGQKCYDARRGKPGTFQCWLQYGYAFVIFADGARGSVRAKDLVRCEYHRHAAYRIAEATGETPEQVVERAC